MGLAGYIVKNLYSGSRGYHIYFSRSKYVVLKGFRDLLVIGSCGGGLGCNIGTVLGNVIVLSEQRTKLRNTFTNRSGLYIMVFGFRPHTHLSCGHNAGA